MMTPVTLDAKQKQLLLLAMDPAAQPGEAANAATEDYLLWVVRDCGCLTNPMREAIKRYLRESDFKIKIQLTQRKKCPHLSKPKTIQPSCRKVFTSRRLTIANSS